MAETTPKKEVVTRYAPSPTGYMHMGNVRSALFAYLFARHNNGKFILRIEDTDKERSKKEFDDGILDAMKWLGFEYDEIYRQSERGAIYRKYLERLLKDGKAYISKEEPREGDTNRRSEVIRFKNPNKVIKFTDLIRGEIEFDTKELGDFVIAKSVDEPIFHLAVAVDDFEMGINYVIRGEDHISNTPRHILIFEAIGAPCPKFAHLPLVLAPDRTKLSKRKHGEMVALEYYRKLGYLAPAIINFLVLIGWNPGTDQEIFSLEELIKEFSVEKVQKGGAIFDTKKLDWLNQHYIRAMSQNSRLAMFKQFAGDNKIFKAIEERGLLGKLDPILTDRVSKFGDLGEMLKSGELDYFAQKPEYASDKLLWKQDLSKENTRRRLDKAAEILQKLADKDFESAESVKSCLWDFAEKEGRGNVLWPIRVALSGKDKSPDPFTLISLLGKNETLERLAIGSESLK